MALCQPDELPLITCTSDYPPAETLSELIVELEKLKPHAPAILKPETVAAGPPAKLRNCHTLELPESKDAAVHRSWIISQKRMPTKEYTSVIGRRDYDLNSGQRKRSAQAWPRTDKDKKRPIALHQWIATCVWGAAPSFDHDAAHVCGNSRCIAAAHIRWQISPKNRGKERAHHKTFNRVHRTRAVRYSIQEWPAFPRTRMDETST